MDRPHHVIRFRGEEREQLMLPYLALPLASPSPPNTREGEKRTAFVEREPIRHLRRLSVHSQNDVAGTRQRHYVLSQPRQ
jgi:hypothetical protein